MRCIREPNKIANETSFLFVIINVIKPVISPKKIVWPKKWADGESPATYKILSKTSGSKTPISEKEAGR